MTAIANAWQRFFREQRDAYALGLLRVAISALLLFNVARLIRELNRNGYFALFFHIPMIPESWLPTSAGYAVLLWVQALAACAALVGFWRPREALLLASSLGLFVLACDRLQYHNNRYALLLLGFLLAFTPCDRSFSITRKGAHALPVNDRLAPTFARRLFQIQVSLVYLGSALGKWFDADWRGGQVLLVRFAKSADYFGARGYTSPNWLSLALASPLVASLAAKLAIATELFIAIGVWLPRTRRLALWVGILFHFWIEVSARVELFSWVMGASYLAFVTPEVEERRVEFNPERNLGRALARFLPWLDWLARFEVAELAPTERELAAFYITDRCGRRARGIAGLCLLAEAVPLLFPLWLPLAVVSRARGRLRASTVSRA